jgi:hypothetical protein
MRVPPCGGFVQDTDCVIVNVELQMIFNILLFTVTNRVSAYDDDDDGRN